MCIRVYYGGGGACGCAFGDVRGKTISSLDRRANTTGNLQKPRHETDRPQPLYRMEASDPPPHRENSATGVEFCSFPCFESAKTHKSHASCAHATHLQTARGGGGGRSPFRECGVGVVHHLVRGDVVGN